MTVHLESPPPSDDGFYRSLDEGGDRLDGAIPSEGAEGVTRRNFLGLGLVGASAMGLAACLKDPREKLLPYTRKPEDVTPGVPLHYATAMTLHGVATGLLVTTYEGRPTKIEGNPGHPASLGAAGVHEQALLQSLYDPHRAQTKHRGEPLSRADLFKEIEALAQTAEEDQGASLRFLLEPSASPLRESVLSRLSARFPKARWVSFSSLEWDAARDGSALLFGRPRDERYDLARAKVVLALDSDFLAGGPAHLVHARGFSERRTPGPAMGRLYAVEPSLTLTGGMADHRLRARPTEVKRFALALLAEVTRRTDRLSPLRRWASNVKPAEGHVRFLEAAADDLLRAGGACAVLVGERQPAIVHAAAQALNVALGAEGVAVFHTAPVLGESERGARALTALVEEIRAGQVATLVVTARNPAYTAPADLDLRGAVSAVRRSLYLGLYEDETAGCCQTFIPAAHELESWGDGRAFDGTHTVAQPLISPLFNGLSELEILAAFLGPREPSPHARLKESFRTRLPEAGFEERWEHVVSEGFLARSAFPWEPREPELAALAAALESDPPMRDDPHGLELAFAADSKVLDGRFANNPWLQELPDPITKITWDNAALLSPATAAGLSLSTGDVANIAVGGRSIDAPVCVLPGHADGTLTVPLGHGRAGSELVARGVGFNANLLRSASSPFLALGATVRKTERRHRLAITQEHGSMEGRPLVVESTLAELPALSERFVEERHPLPTLHVPEPRGEHAWGLSVDLSRCSGCSACVVACQAENNIPVVGKAGVLKSREMHWIRIDRYFKGPVEEPEVVNQPVACVHCEAAPCEYVCPVNATVHSDEGLNEMVYNRCIGTRYCSNNCPYKVRRFNFLDYQGTKTSTEKMAANPDVTLRARGVMEKCTYCVQRIQRVRIDARIAGRAIADGEIQTACQQACSAQALVFGDLADPASKVSRLQADGRRYDLLRELGTRPRTAYLARIRNPNPALGEPGVEKVAGSEGREG